MMGRVFGLLLILVGLMTGLIIGKLVNNALSIWVLVGLWVLVGSGAISIYAITEMRGRIVKDPQVCPKCGKRITRVHRTPFDRFLSIFISNLQRYSCSEPTCKWEGLVIVRDGHHRAHTRPIHLQATHDS
jgi:hypothetical protein